MDVEPGVLPPRGVPVHVRPRDLASGLSDTELVADIWAADARAARYVAERAAAIAALAERRRIDRESEFGSRGGPGPDARYRQPAALSDYSEAFVAELALIRCCTEDEATTLAVEALTLTTTLPGTWSALYEGRIDVRKMQAMVDLLGPVAPATASRVEQLVLPHAETATVAQLRARIRRALARLDAAALEARRVEAQRRADVRAHPVGDGMAQLVVDLPQWQAAACADAIDQYAQMWRADGDLRPIGMIRAEVARDLILRPWDTSRPPVTARLTIHAPAPSLHPAPADAPIGFSQPAAELAGQIVTAAQCRALLEELDMLGIRAAPPGGCVQVAVGDPATGAVLAVATRQELARAAGRTRRRRSRRGPGSTTSDRGAGTHSTGTQSTGTHSTGTHSTGADGGAANRTVDGPGLRPPPATLAYRPTAAQRRFVHARDRRCRMPGCRRRPGRLDIDHARPHADGGATDCANLCCLCRRHHRIKTFARGWWFTLLSDGRLAVRTPSGVSRITRPPGWADEPEPDPPWLDEQAPPDPLSAA